MKYFGKKFHLRHRVAASVFLGLLVFGWQVVRSAEAQTPTPVSTCGDVSGSVILTADLSITDDNCLIVTSANTTIDGNGHSITVSGPNTWAVYAANRSHLTITNVSTNSGAYLYGSTNVVSISDSTFGTVTVAGADDVTVTRSTLSSFSAYALPNNPPYRTELSYNTITGNGSTLVDFNGDDGTTCPPATQFVVSHNTLTSSYQCGGGGQPTCNEPKVLFMRCAGENTVDHNTVRSTGQAMPVRFRDAFDGSLVSDNTFWASGDLSPDGYFGAFNITSGNNDKHFPQNNIFTRNIIRSDFSNAFWVAASGLGNVFSYNTIVGLSGNEVANLGSAAEGSVFQHNTFYNLGSGSVLQFAYRTTGALNDFTNNIFSGIGSMYSFDCTIQQCSPALYQGNNNLFYGRNSAATFGLYGSSLEALKAYVTPDDGYSLEANPLFANPTNLDFSISQNSPAFAAASDGTNIGAWQTADPASDTTKPAAIVDLRVL